MVFDNEKYLHIYAQLSNNGKLVKKVKSDPKVELLFARSDSEGRFEIVLAHEEGYVPSWEHMLSKAMVHSYRPVTLSTYNFTSLGVERWDASQKILYTSGYHNTKRSLRIENANAEVSRLCTDLALKNEVKSLGVGKRNWEGEYFGHDEWRLEGWVQGPVRDVKAVHSFLWNCLVTRSTLSHQ